MLDNDEEVSKREREREGSGEAVLEAYVRFFRRDQSGGMTEGA